MSSLQYLERCRLGSAVTVLASRFSQQDLGWGRDAPAQNLCHEALRGEGSGCETVPESYVRGELSLESLVAGFSPSHEVIRVTKGSSPRRAVSIATPACSCEPSDSSNTATARSGARIVTLALTRELTFVGRGKIKNKNKKMKGRGGKVDGRGSPPLPSRPIPSHPISCATSGWCSLAIITNIYPNIFIIYLPCRLTVSYSYRIKAKAKQSLMGQPGTAPDTPREVREIKQKPFFSRKMPHADMACPHTHAVGATSPCAGSGLLSLCMQQWGRVPFLGCWGHVPGGAGKNAGHWHLSYHPLQMEESRNWVV